MQRTSQTPPVTDVKAGEALSVSRYFTKPGVDPFTTVEWELRDARIAHGERVARVAREQGIPVTANHFVQLLGSAVGRDDKAMAEWAFDHVKKHARFFELLPRLHKQSAMLVLRSAGVPKFHNVLRTLPPQISGKAAIDFDDRVTKCFASIAGFQPDEMTALAVKQLQLPLRNGGSGMTSAAAVAPAAYLSAAALAAPYLNKKFIESRLSHPLARGPVYPPLDFSRPAAAPRAPPSSLGRLPSPVPFKSVAEHVIQRGNALLDRTAIAKSRNSYGAMVAMGYIEDRLGSGAADQ
mgnify:CR=1 FL=1